MTAIHPARPMNSHSFAMSLNGQPNISTMPPFCPPSYCDGRFAAGIDQTKSSGSRSVYSVVPSAMWTMMRIFRSSVGSDDCETS